MSTENRVFLVVIDDSPELHAALRYACRRAKRSGGRVAMLYVTEPPETQQWGAVAELMREEERQKAEAAVSQHAATAMDMTGQAAIIHIREGQIRDQLLKLIDEDQSISILVLGMGSGPDGPGPLVSAMAGKYSTQLRVPVTLVPGGLSDAQVDAIS
ncbi:MAG: universal stress protein [Alphaproteobacteria bacterium]|nr:universal stress protein [Alphaproteobacteria bacterium]